MQSTESKHSYTRPILVGAAVVVVIAAAVSISGRNRPPADPRAAAAMRMMRSDLEGLVQAEAMTKQITGSYHADAERAGQLQSLGVDRPVITLTDKGWSAIVTHLTVPGVRCAVAVDARNPLRRRAESGEIICE